MLRNSGNKLINRNLKRKDIEKYLKDGTFRAEIQRLSNEGLKRCLDDRSVALKYARQIVEKLEPENLNDEHINKLADGMQLFAQVLLKERSRKAKNKN